MYRLYPEFWGGGISFFSFLLLLLFTLQFATTMTLDTVAMLMNEFLREENRAYCELLRRANRRLSHMQRLHAIMDSRLDEATVDNTLLRRILHEIFADHPSIREAYNQIVYFEDLESDNDEEMINDVARELNFDDL